MKIKVTNIHTGEKYYIKKVESARLIMDDDAIRLCIYFESDKDCNLLHTATFNMSQHVFDYIYNGGNIL